MSRSYHRTPMFDEGAVPEAIIDGDDTIRTANLDPQTRHDTLPDGAVVDSYVDPHESDTRDMRIDQ